MRTADTKHNSLPHTIGSGSLRPQDEETISVNGIHPTKNMIPMTYHVYFIRIHHSPLFSLLQCAWHAFILELSRAVACQPLALAKLQFRNHLIAHVRAGGNRAAFQAMA